MKNTAVFLLLVAALVGCSSDSAGQFFDEGNFRMSYRENYQPEYPKDPQCKRFKNTDCFNVIIPVCGSDGYTYRSPCMLCRQIQDTGEYIEIVNDGEC